MICSAVSIFIPSGRSWPLNLLRDDSRREGVDKHEASAAEPPPIRPLRAQGPTGADGSDRADETITTGERAPD